MGQDPDAIRQEIEESRERLGDTVEALSYKTDVKARVKETVSEKKDALIKPLKRAKEQLSSKASDIAPEPSELKETAKQAARGAKPNPLLFAAGAAVVAYLVVRKRNAVLTPVKEKLAGSKEQLTSNARPAAGLERLGERPGDHLDREIVGGEVSNSKPVIVP